MAKKKRERRRRRRRREKKKSKKMMMLTQNRNSIGVMMIKSAMMAGNGRDYKRVRGCLFADLSPRIYDPS